MEKDMQYTPAGLDLMLRKILLEIDQGARVPHLYKEIKLRWVEAGLRGVDLKTAIQEASALGWIEQPGESEEPSLRLSDNSEVLSELQLRS